MRLFLLVVIPFLFTILISLFGERSERLRATLVMTSSLLVFMIVLSLTALVAQDHAFPLNGLTLIDRLPILIRFQADSIALYMGLLVSFLWNLTNIYSFGYMAHEHSHTRYFASLNFCLGATMGVIFADNLLTLFIFYELLTIGVYPLVIHEETEEAYRGGIVYGAYLLTGGALLLLGMVIIYSLTGGNLTFASGGILTLTDETRPYLYILFVIFCSSFGIKSALMPYYNWLPIAMVAPTPISAVLHAVAVVNMGLYGMIRVIFNIYGIDLFHALGLDCIIGIMASFTILAGAIVALRQKEIKGMLAYSTVNQLSYVILGAVSFKYISMLGAILHIVYHSFMKITLFYCAGAIITQTGNKYIKGMKGLAKKMPITMVTFTIAAIGVIGLPPICGWLSKWYMVQGYIELKYPVFAGVFILSGIIELGYFTPPIFLAWFAEDDHEEETTETHEGDDSNGHHPTRTFGGPLWTEAPMTMLVPIVIVCVASILYGVWGFLPHKFAIPALNELLGEGYKVAKF